jgi:hypothetical protein
MKLDKRIKDNRIGDCFSTNEFTQYLTQPCYFANNIDEFKDLKLCKYANLVLIAQDRASAYYTALNDADSWKFCLPAAYVEPGSEPKTLRPFRTVKELPFTVGDIVYTCTKDSEIVEKCLCTSIVSNNDEIIQIDLGSTIYEPQILCKHLKYKEIETGKFKPFGILE